MLATPEEQIQYFIETGHFPSPMWVHALDLLKHVLMADTVKTFFQNPNPSPQYLEELTTWIEDKPQLVDKFVEARENVFTTERRWQRFDSESGELVVEKYIDGDDRPFDDYRKKHQPKPAVELILDMGVPHCERGLDHMKKRHEQIYRKATDANSEGRPCRVIAAVKMHITECHDQRWLIVLKDYEDPIFPAIWAAFEHNRLCNSFINSIQDYFIGTYCGANGYHEEYNIAEDITGEVHLIEPVCRAKFDPEQAIRDIAERDEKGSDYIMRLGIDRKNQAKYRARRRK